MLIPHLLEQFLRGHEPGNYVVGRAWPAFDIASTASGACARATPGLQASMPSLPRLADDPPRGCHYAARFLTDGAGQEFGEAVWIEVAPMLRGVNGTVLADVPRTIRREQGLGKVRACLVGDSRVSGRDGVEQQALRDGYGHRVDDAALLHCWRAAAPPGSDALARELLDRWREPHRHYHTLAHLAAMLAIVGQWPVVELAVWFHDAVYDPRATDNEEASAELAERSLPAVGAAPATVAEVARLVRLTATHDSAPGDGAGALLCDADLSILAADPARYDAYAAAVRREYGHVPDEVFRIGRAEVLRHLLGLPVLYRVVPERAQWEVRARANLTRELSALA